MTKAILTTVVSFPKRGPWGDQKFRGNCSGYLVKMLCEYFEPHNLLDPMEGSGTSRDVAEELGLAYFGSDIQNGPSEDVFRQPWGDLRFDLVFVHPPYGPMIRYGHGDGDLSELPIKTYREELVALVEFLFANAVEKGGCLVVLIGTMRKNGKLYPFQRDLIEWREPSEPEIIKVQHNVTSPSSRTGQLYGHKFIPILDERVLIWKKKE